MSEVKDEFIYNFYDFIKSIYIYSHVKTDLKDKGRQRFESYSIYALMVFMSLFIILTVFKIVVIIIYFLFLQALTGFFKFLASICKTKCNVSFCSSFKNSISFLCKICKRIYTFNFYIYDNCLIGFIMTGSFILFLISSFFFFIYNCSIIEQVEKPIWYLVFFYLDFELTILIELLCNSFYSCRNMVMSTYLALGLFLIMNGVLFIGYFYVRFIEDKYGSFEYQEPQKIINLIFDGILLVLNINSLRIIIAYNKNCKFFNI